MNDDDTSDYEFSPFDRALVAQAHQALGRCFKDPKTSWAEKVSIAKLLHVFSRLPVRSSSANAEVSITSSRYRYREKEVVFFFNVGVSDQNVTISLTGYHHDLDAGGDSFSVFSWNACPGEEAEMLDHLAGLRAVTAIVDPMKALRDMTSSNSIGEFSVVDHDNELIEDQSLDGDASAEDDDEDAEESDDEDDEDDESIDDSDGDETGEAPQVVLVTPMNAADRMLLAQLDPQRIRRTSAGEATGLDSCDRCQADFSTLGLAVDGGTPGSPWGNYCSACSLAMKLKIGWGSGQLYARQPDGTWHGVAGFRP